MKPDLTLPHIELPHVPASVPALPVCAGTVAGVFCGVTDGVTPILPIAGCVFVLAVAVWFLHRPRTAAFIAFVALGMMSAYVRMPMDLPQGVAGTDGILTGHITKADLNGKDNFIVEDGMFTMRDGQTVALSHQPVNVRVINPDTEYRLGETVCVRGRLQSVEDLNRPDVPYSDDFAAAARVKGYTGFITARDDSVSVLGYEPTLGQQIATHGNEILHNSSDRYGRYV